MKTYCTEYLIGSKVYCNLIDAEDWEEAEELCADNEYVIGELVETIPFFEN